MTIQDLRQVFDALCGACSQCRNRLGLPLRYVPGSTQGGGTGMFMGTITKGICLFCSDGTQSPEATAPASPPQNTHALSPELQAIANLRKG